MGDFAPPSFSLGLDFDLDSEPQTTVREDPSYKTARQSSTSANLRTVEDFGDDDFESPTLCPDPQASDPRRTLKRLRRGPITEATSESQRRQSVGLWCNVDDEIEEFSFPQDRCRADEPPSTGHHSVYSSSKFSLPGHGALTTQSERTKKQVSDAPASANMETSSSKLMFPKLTISPLRRFQLIDSDSDSDDPVSEGANREANEDSFFEERESYPSQYLSSREQRRTKAPVTITQTQDLWDDLCSEKSFHIPTPALDEFCEEYFRSMKDKSKCENNTKSCYQSRNGSKNNGHQLNLGDLLPPAHLYFSHDDVRIQKLVCSRLPNFFPLDVVNNRGYKQASESVIDYMGQFNHGEGSKQAAGKNKTLISSTRSRKKSNKSSAEEAYQGSRSWVNPKHCTEIPKVAGKRRVHAVGQSAGHWYTGPNGKRVYVTKYGQELSGQSAYRRYRKENGAWSKKSKKRAAKKKK